MGSGDGQCRIGGGAIGHHDGIHNASQALDTAGQVPLFAEGQDDGCEGHAGSAGISLIGRAAW